MFLLVQNEGPRAIADIAEGVLVWGKHEITERWGWYPISRVEFFTGECLQADIRGEVYRTSPSHLWDFHNAWRMMAGVAGATSIGTRRMAKITVQDAHTYWLLARADADAGMLSHNKLAEEP